SSGQACRRSAASACSSSRLLLTWHACVLPSDNRCPCGQRARKSKLSEAPPQTGIGLTRAVIFNRGQRRKKFLVLSLSPPLPRVAFPPAGTVRPSPSSLE